MFWLLHFVLESVSLGMCLVSFLPVMNNIYWWLLNIVHVGAFNHGHNTLKLYNISEKFGFITTKALVGIYYKKHCLRNASPVAKQLKIKVSGNYALLRKCQNWIEFDENKTFVIAVKNCVKAVIKLLGSCPLSPISPPRPKHPAQDCLRQI